MVSYGLLIRRQLWPYDGSVLLALGSSECRREAELEPAMVLL